MVCDGILWIRNEIPSLPIIATMSSLEEKQELDGLRRLDPQVISKIFPLFAKIITRYRQYPVMGSW